MNSSPCQQIAYSTTIDPDATIRGRKIAEHKFEVKEFETYLCVENALGQKIRKAVNDEWLEGIRHQSMGFVCLTPKQMLDHLKQGGALLDYMNVSELTTKLTEPWDGNENPATRFARDDRYECHLIKAGLPNQQVLHLNIAQASFKVTGLYDGPLCKFDARAKVDRTFVNFRPFIINEYAKKAKSQDTAKSAGFGIANGAQVKSEQQLMDAAARTALAFAGIANLMQEHQDKSIKKIMALFADTLKKFTPTPNTSNNLDGNSGGNANQNNLNRRQRQKCPHCHLRHAKPASECWELLANVVSHPANWKTAAKCRQANSAS